MPYDINQKPFDEGTITKLEIFERYLENWLPVFINSPAFKNVLICDFFAGSGCDSEGAPGSPLRILKVINKFHKDVAKRECGIQVILNDRRQDKAKRLKSLVRSESAQMQRKFGDLLSIECYCDDFLKLFSDLYKDFSTQPNLIFIDQNGIKYVNDDLFQRLIALDKTDFLFFISSSSFRRFAGRPSFQKYFPDLAAGDIRKAKYEYVHIIILDYYRGKIPRDNSTLLYPFTIKKGANIYGLVFGSKHPLGVEKFLNIAWKENELNGVANFDIDDDREKQQPTLFVNDPTFHRLTKIEIFELDVENFIRRNRQVTNRQVFDFALANGHAPRNARKALRELRKAGKIDYNGNIGCSYDSCYSKNRNIQTIRIVNNG